MKQCDLLIRNVRILTPEYTIEENRYAAIRGNRIEALGADAECPYTAPQTLRGEGKLLMPGLVDGHTHACQYMLRGKLADEYPMVWTRILVPFESGLNEEDCHLSGQLSMLQQIKSGITTTVESGSSHMHAVAQAALESGIRARLARSTMDQGGFIPPHWKETAQECIDRTEAFYRDCNGMGDGRIGVFYAMRQVMSCSPALLEMIADRSRAHNTFVHAHLAEHRDEVSYCLQHYQLRPAEVLDRFSLVNDRLVAAHCVSLSEQEIDLLAEKHVRICHCPRANLGNHGIPKTPRLLHAGLKIGIGSDGGSGCNMDLFEELRLLRFSIQAVQGLPIFDPVILPIRTLLDMLVCGGAHCAGLEREAGKVQEGCLADLILLDVEQPHILPTASLVNVLVEGVRASDVTDSIIDGKLVMRDRRILTMDEEKLRADGTQRMKEIYRRAGI